MSKSGNGVITVNSGVVNLHPERREDGSNNDAQLGKDIPSTAFQLLRSTGDPFLKPLVRCNCFVYESNYLVPGLLGGQNKLRNFLPSVCQVLLKVRSLHQGHPWKVEEVIRVVEQVNTDYGRHSRLKLEFLPPKLTQLTAD